MQSDRQIAICNAYICKSNENQKKTCRYLANKIAQPWQRCGNKWMMCVICLYAYIFSSVLSHLHCSSEYQSKIVMSNVSKMRDFQREKWYFCLLQTQFNMKKWKPWKINSSWRDCLFSFLFEFLPHCVWLKMIMKCKLFEILTRHLFQKKRNTLYSFWKSFCQWTENADCLQGERDYFPSSHDLNWMFSIVSKWILILSNFRIINKKIYQKKRSIHWIFFTIDLVARLATIEII